MVGRGPLRSRDPVKGDNPQSGQCFNKATVVHTAAHVSSAVSLVSTLPPATACAAHPSFSRSVDARSSRPGATWRRQTLPLSCPPFLSDSSPPPPPSLPPSHHQSRSFPPFSPFSTFLIPCSFLQAINQLQPSIQFSPPSSRSICHLFFSSVPLLPSSADEIIPAHSSPFASVAVRAVLFSLHFGYTTINHLKHQQHRTTVTP